jgi:hypothetical protein
MTEPTATSTAAITPAPAVAATPVAPAVLASAATGTVPSGPPPDITTLPGGWQVEPSQMTAFAAAVQQVRSDLNAVFQQANQLTSTAYQPQLGSSPVGQALAAKFMDRLSGDQGLLSNLNAVLNHLDQFVSNAEQSAAGYQQADSSTADTLKTTST